jgi:rubrerythrin
MNTVDELLIEAMNAETKAKEFYLQAAEKAQSASGRDLFKQLADFEKNHYERVKSVIDARTQGSSLPASLKQDIPHIKAEIEGEIEPNKDEIVDVINKAIKAEQDAQARYKKIADLFDTAQDKEIFNDLAEEESTHQRILEDQFYHMSNKGTIIWGE